MYKGREIIGLPVVSLAAGKEIGVVEDILWSHPELKIHYLVIDEKGALNRSRYLPFTEIISIGTDAVTVSGQQVVEEEDEVSVGKSVKQTGGELVMTQDGKNLGTLEDVVFDADEGKLLGYEVSTGLVGDLLSGRMTLPPEMICTWGKEAIITGYTCPDRGDQDAVPDMPG